MASAYAKFTGELGVCIATSGPGASHLVTGLYDARLDHMPVLAIAGQQARTALGGHYQQEVDLPALFKDVAGAFVQQASVAGAGASSGRSRDPHRARRAARDRDHPAQRSAGGAIRGAAARAWHAAFRASASPSPKTVPYEADLQRAADVLNAGKKVAILVGAGALGRDRRSHRGRRPARRRRRQGAARQGRAAGRSALGDRLDRPARHRAELRADDGMRHAADDRLGLSLFGVPAEGRPGARRADRHRARHAVVALSDGGQSRRRRGGDAARAAAAA